MPDEDPNAYYLMTAGEQIVAYSWGDEPREIADYILDPGTETWSELPDDPLSAGFDRFMRWSGGELLLFDHELVARPTRDSPLRGAALDLTDGAWRVLDDPRRPSPERVDAVRSRTTLCTPARWASRMRSTGYARGLSSTGQPVPGSSCRSSNRSRGIRRDDGRNGRHGSLRLPRLEMVRAARQAALEGLALVTAAGVAFTTSSPLRYLSGTPVCPSGGQNRGSVPKVLIIEDDDVIAEGMSRHLTTAGFDPLWVNKGESGLARLRYERPDVCVLDLMLPGIDGWKLIETARSEGIGTPIVVVSARGTEHDRVHALEIGADDYLVKPFSMKELVARVRAAARRGVRVQDERRGEPIEIEELTVDPLNVQAYVRGESAELTPTEFRLLYALALEQGRVVTRDELLQKVWGRRLTHRDRTVDVFVRKIRDKLESFGPGHTFVQTRYGVGYKLEAVPK